MSTSSQVTAPGKNCWKICRADKGAWLIDAAAYFSSFTEAVIRALWYDDQHPSGAAHHEKIVVVDDSLAFIGGMDPFMSTAEVAGTDDERGPARERSKIWGYVLPALILLTLWVLWQWI